MFMLKYFPFLSPMFGGIEINQDLTDTHVQTYIDIHKHIRMKYKPVRQMIQSEWCPYRKDEEMKGYAARTHCLEKSTGPEELLLPKERKQPSMGLEPVLPMPESEGLG